MTEKCADIVQASAEDSIETIRLLLCPEESDVELHPVSTPGQYTLGLDNDCSKVDIDGECLESYRDSDGEIDLEDLVSDQWFDIREAAYEGFCEHGLSFDYCDDTEDGEHYFRYQISWGGPSTEIRFYANADQSLYRAEFWYLDWYDGASVNVTKDPTVQALWENFVECETVAYAIEKASAND